MAGIDGLVYPEWWTIDEVLDDLEEELAVAFEQCMLLTFGMNYVISADQVVSACAEDGYLVPYWSVDAWRRRNEERAYS